MKRALLLLCIVIVIFTFSFSALADELIEIEIGIASTSQQASIDFLEQVLIPTFEAQNPGIKVNTTVIGWSFDNYVTRYLAGVGPDALQIGGDRIGTYVDMIEPLDEYVRDWEAYADFPPVLMEGASVDGKLYGIPFSTVIRGTFYRIDQYNEAGLDETSGPKTWDDLVTHGQRLTRWDSDGNMVRQGVFLNNHWFTFAPFLFQAGGDFMGPERQTFTYADTHGLEALSFMQELVQVHEVSQNNAGLGDILTGQTAIEVRQAGLLNDPDLVDVIGITEPVQHREQLTLAYSDMWVINNDSPNRDAAWKWISFVAEIDNMVGYSNAQRGVPPRMSGAQYAPWSEDPRYGVLYASTIMAKPLPSHNRHIDQVRRNFIAPYLTSIIYENAPVTEFVEAERLANAYINSQ